MKKAQGLSMNVIIIAALALLVLVILSIIFMGRIGPWAGDVKNCELMGGDCTSGSSCAAGYEISEAVSISCLTAEGKVDPKKTCCMPKEI